MGQLIHLSGPDKPSQPRPTPKSSSKKEGVGGIELTPPMIAAVILVVAVLLGGFFFWRPGAMGAAATPMMDTGTQSVAPGDPAKHANGMDSSTESSGPASTNNGMDTSTGR